MIPQQQPEEDSSSSVIVDIPLQQQEGSSSISTQQQSLVVANSSSSEVSSNNQNDLMRKIQHFQSFSIVGTEKMESNEGDGFSFFSNQHSVYYRVKVTYLLEREIVSYTLNRRYTHFKNLFDRMIALKQGQKIIYNNETLEFPEKEKWDSFFNWKTDDIIKQRTTLFGKLLMEIYENREFYLVDSEIFSFFSPSKYTDDE